MQEDKDSLETTQESQKIGQSKNMAFSTMINSSNMKNNFSIIIYI